jgi:hypothetical protein
MTFLDIHKPYLQLRTKRSIKTKKNNKKKEQHVLSTTVQMLDVITSFNFNFFFAVLFEVNVDGVSIF